MSDGDHTEDELRFTVLGRTLEHFGVQMYKRRDTAIAELVANCWDAGAGLVDVSIPPSESYNPDLDEVRVLDDGRGMTFREVADEYLVLGRNRRKEDGQIVGGRPLMGRKGIGKLAGFGLGSTMRIVTWRDGFILEFDLALAALKVGDGQASDIPIPWRHLDEPPAAHDSGTLVVLTGLKHASALDAGSLSIALARRFTRSVQGLMTITVNGSDLPDPTPALDKRIPETNYLEHMLPSGGKVRYWYGFAHDVIKSKELRGFTVLVSGKTAQAPPFFFDVEATATGQHSTRYVIGEIEADYLDAGIDDDSDVISTDRQEIDWEDHRVSELASWGRDLSRKALAECRDFRGEKTERVILEDPDISARITTLDQASQTQIRKFLRVLGLSTAEEEVRPLADALVRAYEFRQFHDVLKDIEAAAEEDPDHLREVLSKLSEWKVLESRAILEIVNGRLSIIDRFQTMLVNDAPETAHRRGDDNIHDLLGRFPWLLNPEWQVLAEEKKITTQLREWAAAEIPEDILERFDFLALAGSGRLVVLEIKRPGYAVEIEDLTRAQTYADRLSRGRGEGITTVVICGGNLNVSEQVKANWDRDPLLEIRPWRELFDRSRMQYERYRALLEGDVQHRDFSEAAVEVASTRQVLDADSSYRTPAERRGGLGRQDSSVPTPESRTDETIGQ